MADHTHEWALELEEAHGGQFYCAAHCAICNLEMPIDETNRRLNATERPRCPDPLTAKALADQIKDNRISSPWRDAGIRLIAFGKWLEAVALDAK